MIDPIAIIVRLLMNTGNLGCLGVQSRPTGLCVMKPAFAETANTKIQGVTSVP